MSFISVLTTITELICFRYFVFAEGLRFLCWFQQWSKWIRCCRLEINIGRSLSETCYQNGI